MVDLENVAEAAVEVITGSGHHNAIYELCGSESLSQDEVADIISRKLDRPVKAERVLIEIWEVRRGLPGWMNTRSVLSSKCSIITTVRVYRKSAALTESDRPRSDDIFRVH